MATITQLQQVRSSRAAVRRRGCPYEDVLQDALLATTYEEATHRGKRLAQAIVEYLYAHPHYAGSNVFGQVLARVACDDQNSPLVGVQAGLLAFIEERLCGISMRTVSVDEPVTSLAM
ncbi:hypothetical protein [Burkholderia cepacia]|uniref:hypothetical protein n=1 Tax=Burkholderia cepacia TaxID=292 RepID=UPI002AB5DE90|nr:hypothetical protein [Burkholderia cepacia]